MPLLIEVVWGKIRIPLELDDAATLDQLRVALHEKTGVAPAMQKISGKFGDKNASKRLVDLGAESAPAVNKIGMFGNATAAPASAAAAGHSVESPEALNQAESGTVLSDAHEDIDQILFSELIQSDAVGALVQRLTESQVDWVISDESQGGGGSELSATEQLRIEITNLLLRVATLRWPKFMTSLLGFDAEKERQSCIFHLQVYSCGVAVANFLDEKFWNLEVSLEGDEMLQGVSFEPVDRAIVLEMLRVAKCLQTEAEKPDQLQSLIDTVDPDPDSIRRLFERIFSGPPLPSHAFPPDTELSEETREVRRNAYHSMRIALTPPFRH
jgi:hypothetical protein